jgi:cell wall-associated NlpC family hydrolase
MKNSFFYSKISLLLVVILAGCAGSHQQKIETLISETKATYVPDSRVSQFNVEVLNNSGTLVLKGETTLPEAKKALLESLSKDNITVTDNITVLPDAALGAEIYGLVNNSVSNIRSQPKHSAQLATQALLGMPLKVLKQEGGWYYVRTPDDYLSWVDGGGIQRMDKAGYDEWKNSDKIIYQNTYGFSYAKPSKSAEKVTDLAAGNILELVGTSGSYYKAAYPDGRIAYVPKNEAKELSEWGKNLNTNQASLVATAKTMMGVPYLWGGTSTKGVDCSGFTKTIFFMNGMIIPRDASQQVNAGTLVDTTKNWDSLEVGDLLFFGVPATKTKKQRVVHVGMWIGDNQFIHSSHQVRISSVNPNAPNYDESNVNRYLQARRYLNNTEGNIIQTTAMYSEME